MTAELKKEIDRLKEEISSTKNEQGKTNKDILEKLDLINKKLPLKNSTGRSYCI